MWISDFAWSTPLRKSCTVLAAIFGLIAAFASAWPVMEPFIPAHRAYARDLTEHVEKVAENYATKNAAILRDVQIEQAEGKRDAVASELFKWQVELNKTSDENIKPMVQEQIRRLNNIQDKLNDQIKTLNAIKQKQ
jgi:predicted negative regulator of RcsB-dependent stress response